LVFISGEYGEYHHLACRNLILEQDNEGL